MLTTKSRHKHDPVRLCMVARRAISMAVNCTLDRDIVFVLETTFCWLGCWRFKPSQPQRIISGLKETCIQRYIAEGTNKADIRLEEQREKAESCLETLWNEIQFKGP